MAVQLGESCQIVSGGFLCATPHCVKGAKPVPGSNVKVTRASFPVFCGTDPFFKMSVPKNCTEEQVTTISVGADRVPPIKGRYENGITFGDFLTRTFALFYEHTEAAEKHTPTLSETATAASTPTPAN